jgi:hypothetical protein
LKQHKHNINSPDELNRRRAANRLAVAQDMLSPSGDPISPKN